MEPRDTTNLAELYDLPPLQWSRARDGLATGTPRPETACFLGTVRPDGRPHSAGIGLAVARRTRCTSPAGRPRARRATWRPTPPCTLSVRLPGLDLVLEGEAVHTTDPATLDAIAAIYRDGGWPAQVDGDALTAPFSAPSAGPPPWHVYRFTYHTVFAVASAEPHGATRWRF